MPRRTIRGSRRSPTSRSTSWSAKDDFTLEPTTAEVIAAEARRAHGPPADRARMDARDRAALASTRSQPERTRRHAHTRARFGVEGHEPRLPRPPRVLGRVEDAGQSQSAERGYDLVPQGFAVPLQAYQDFIEHPPNADVRAKIDELVTRRAGRRALAEAAQRARRRHPVRDHGGVLPARCARASPAPSSTLALPGVEKIKVRSSANAEDVPNFDGAGLHDSFAADTDKRDRPDRAVPRRGRMTAMTAT